MIFIGMQSINIQIDQGAQGNTVSKGRIFEIYKINLPFAAHTSTKENTEEKQNKTKQKNQDCCLCPAQVGATEGNGKPDAFILLPF